MKPLVAAFNQEASDPLPETYFCGYLQELFGRETAAKTATALERMGLPLPEARGEFLEGYEGAILFLNKHGLVIRIEGVETRQGHIRSDRINDSGWILQPLASIAAGDVVIEVCPGCHLEDDEGSLNRLVSELAERGVGFWDSNTGNIGRLPVATPAFPDGVPVVIDRLSVRQLTDSVKPIAEALEQANEAQETLYGPLRRAFREGWEGKGGMDLFWALCATSVAEGKLLAGWNELAPRARVNANMVKGFAAVDTAATYERKQEWKDGLKRSDASAVRQSLHPPA